MIPRGGRSSGRVGFGAHGRARRPRRGSVAFAFAITFALGTVAACGETTGLILGETPAEDAASPILVPDASPCPGCPVLVTLDGESETTQQGGTTGTPYVDTCPGDQVVIGFQGFLTAPSVGLTLVGAIQAHCGSLVLVGVAPDSVATVAGPTLPIRGSSITDPWTQTCPANQVVVGFFGRSGADLDQVAFQCAPWTPADGGSDVLSIGSTTVTSSGAGGDGGLPFEDMCPTGQVARGTSLRAGSWIDAFGLVCGTPALASDSGAP
jgi:hypothetical protein